MHDLTVIGERALTLREAAALLRVSYNTVYARREELGFFKIGSVWRIWPDDLKKAVGRQDYNESRPARVELEKNACLSANARVPTSGTSISARQAAAELDKLLARQTKRRRRSFTTS